MSKNTVVIHGIKYKAVDSKRKRIYFTCKDCDIYKAKIPQSMMQLPLCCDIHKPSRASVDRRQHSPHRAM